MRSKGWIKDLTKWRPAAVEMINSWGGKSRTPAELAGRRRPAGEHEAQPWASGSRTHPWWAWRGCPAPDRPPPGPEKGVVQGGGTEGERWRFEWLALVFAVLMTSERGEMALRPVSFTSQLATSLQVRPIVAQRRTHARPPPAHLLELVWVARQQVDCPGQHRPGGLMSRHLHQRR